MVDYTSSGDPRRSIELLWGTRQPSRRGPKPKLTVEGITAAAIALADADGLEAVSMRGVAERLGVTGMSLYTYVPGKAELLDLMVDTVCGEATPPDDSADGWRQRLEHVARDNWRLYLRHPWLLQVATSRPVLGPNLVGKYDHELRTVAGSGLADIEMDLVITVVNNYVHGAVRSAVEVSQAERRTGMTDLEWWEAYGPALAEVFDADRFPTAAAVGAAAGEEYGAAVAPERAFEFGLRLLLDGLESFIAGRNDGRAGDATRR